MFYYHLTTVLTLTFEIENISLISLWKTNVAKIENLVPKKYVWANLIKLINWRSSAGTVLLRISTFLFEVLGVKVEPCIKDVAGVEGCVLGDGVVLLGGATVV